MDTTQIPDGQAGVPVDARVQMALHQDFARLDSLDQRHQSLILTPPDAGTRAAVALADPLGKHASHQAGTALAAAVDHLNAWRSLFMAGKMPLYAHFSLLRTAQEAALVAYWLMDPAIDEETRTARGVATQKEDYKERGKYEVAADRKRPPRGKLASERLAELMQAATIRGLTRLNKKGEQILRVPIPTTVELFDMYESCQAPAKAQSIYRYYSGCAHAKPWALMVGIQEHTTPDDSGNAIGRIVANDDMMLLATQRAIDATERAIEALEAWRQ